MNKQVMHTALIALGAFAACVIVQRFVPIPVIGSYLPGGSTTTA